MSILSYILFHFMDPIFVNTLIAMLLGAAIGLKGEMDQKESTGENRILGGFRTHAFLALLGALSAILSINGNMLFSALLSGSIMIMIIGYYINGAVNKGAYGITSEITALFAHFVGILMIMEPVSIKYIIAISILIIFIVTRRTEIRSITKKISRNEVIEFSLFAIISLVVLPYLPNRGFSLNDFLVGDLRTIFSGNSLQKLLSVEIINPFTTWFIVVFVSGIDLFGYLLAKIFSSAKSKFLSAIVGGLVSSTSTTIALANQSKGEKDPKKINQLLAAALGANGVSFIQVLILVLPISLVFFKQIFLPTFLMILSAFSYALLFLWLNKTKAEKNAHLPKTENGSSFKIVPALKFALLLTTIKFFSKIALVYLGSNGFVVAAVVASIGGVDAIIITMADLINKGSISLDLALFTYLLITLVNIISKIVYSYFGGSKNFVKKFAFFMIIVFLTAFIAGLINFL